nr:hypothetical protein [Candidatus Sigynarchaeota archaeon]
MDAKTIVSSFPAWRVLLFFAMIGGGVVLHLLLDFIQLKYLSGYNMQFWLFVFGFRNSTMQQIGSELYIYPVSGDPTNFFHILKDCTPSLAIYVFLAIFFVPEDSLRRRVGTYLLAVVALSSVLGIGQAIEMIMGVNGVSWDVAHNDSLNFVFVFAGSCFALFLLCKLLPHLPIVLAYPFAAVYVKYRHQDVKS